MSASNQAWSWIPDWYEPLSSVKGWKKCKRCGEFPRVWAFNNGLSAKCCCSDLYGQPEAEAESVCSYANRNSGSLIGYSEDRLRENWNKRVETGEKVLLSRNDGIW